MKFRKAIYTRRRLQKKYWKTPTSANELWYKQQRNKCVSLRKKSMKLYLNKLAADDIVTNKSFNLLFQKTKVVMHKIISC